MFKTEEGDCVCERKRRIRSKKIKIKKAEEKKVNLKGPFSHGKYTKLMVSNNERKKNITQARTNKTNEKGAYVN